MKKRTFVMFVLLALAVGLYMTANAKGDRIEPTQTAQASRTSTSTAKPDTCKVYTGVDGGTVNLRSCAGTSCGVMQVLTEGESLTILTAGLWVNVTTESGVTGWLYSKYCEVKR
ncbi:MAG: SH3 domain-containing protein [Chloroflexota bacterium]